MFKKFPFFLLLLFCNVLNAQSLWEETSESNIPRTGERRIIPQKYKVYQLKLNTLLPILQAAPERFKSNFAESDVVLTLPNAQGNTLQFRLQESPVMEPELQSRYPNIRCYTGRGMDDPSALIKCDLGPWGFHAMVIRPGKSTLFIDPYQHGNRDYYIVYEKSDYLPKKEDALYTCGTATDGLTELSLKNNNSEVQGDCRLRKYRLALACTGEYASFHGGTKPLVLAAMNTTMNRVNGIYEDEIAITMQLVAKNDTLIFLNANSDPYTNNDGATMLGQNVSTCNARIGSANYDIGHVFSTGGGGIAGLGVVCSNSKAQGVTGSSSPVGDAFDVDYVAHEMGHQFGANHTQNNNCNRVTGAAMEPGSASTIMGYAGICSPNVQSNSDDYFHAYSLQEINAYSILGSGNTCAVKVTTGNNNPSVSAGADYIIPKSTYFALTASGSDPDNDALSYCWEQMDPEFATMPPVSTSTTGPLFRSFKGTSAPTRYFPRLADIVNNVSPTWEVLPSVSRTMRFRVTVRDNNPAGSCSKEDDVVLSVNSATGPFQVSAPNTNVVWFVGENKTVSWLVNGTNGAPINCANVKISLSTDGGFTYPVILANSVPNTGSANVTVPNNLSNTCRVKVEAIGNIFFDISNVNFSIQQPPTPTFLIAASPSNTQVCANSGNTVTFNLSLSAIAGFNAQVNLSVSGAPAGATVNISPNQVTPNGTATVSISGFLPAMAGNYNLVFAGSGGSINQSTTAQLSVLPGAPTNAANGLFPADGYLGFVPGTAISWKKATFAGSYTLELASNPSFSPASIIGAYNTSDTSIVPSLQNNTVYYWRVKCNNLCGAGPTTTVYAFQTSDKACNQTFNSSDVPKVIDANSVNTISSNLNISQTNFIQDINAAVKISHTYVGDLVATLTSPWGQDFRLFDQPGVPADQFGCSNDNIDVVFDDEAANSAAVLEGTCSASGIAIQGAFQAIDTLNAMKGKNASGVWKLKINDTYADDGGSLTSWSLTFCFPVALPQGAILVNKALQTPSGGIANLDNTYLSMQLSGTAAQGRYTITYLPSHGVLRLSGVPLSLGATITQSDINNGLISYQNNGDLANTDQFSFDALDINNNAWVHNGIFTFNVVKNNLLVSATQTLPVPCVNGAGAEITVVASGLNGQYLYSLNNGPQQSSNVFKNLTAGAYTVVVTGQFGFTASSNVVVISNPSPVNATATVQKDTILVSASGGAGNYTYSINGDFQSDNVFTGLPNGIYAVTVQDANGCNTSVQAIVAVNTLLVSAVVVSNVLCAGGNEGIVSINVGGGTPPFTYSLNNGPFQNNNGVFSGLYAGSYTIVVQDEMGFQANTNTVVLNNPSVLNNTVSSNLNTITVSGSGGTPPYTYSIGNGPFQSSGLFTNLTNGTYQVIVRDANGCTSAQNVIVNIPALVLSATNSTSVSCAGGNDGEITAYAKGGIPPYQYIINMAPFQMDSIFSGLSAGVYNILVRDAQGTEANITTTVTEPQPLVVIADVTDNNAVLTYSGGTMPYSYLINGVFGGNLTGLPIGVYDIVARDANGCTASTTFEVFGNTIVASASVVLQVSCFGSNDGVALICVDGGYEPIQLDTLPGAFIQEVAGACAHNYEISNLAPGNYQLQVSDVHGYSKTVAFNIQSPAPLLLDLQVSGDTVLANASGGTPPFQYNANGSVFQDSPLFPDLLQGIYSFQVLDANGCITTSEEVLVVSASFEPAEYWGIQIAPNPSSGVFRVQMQQAQGSLQFQIRDLAGRTLEQKVFDNQSDSFSTLLDLSRLPQGLYLLVINDGHHVGSVRLEVIR